PRYTDDIDILVRPSPDNAARLESVIQAFGFGSLGLSARDFQQENQIIQLGYPPNRIDILTTISGVSFDEAWQGRQFGDLDGTQVPFLNKECLVRNKKASGRDKDLEDLKRLG
ncbi:MAG: hypothetical protein ACREUU_06735, partial [Gammaproteobacteria bacterium]